MSNDASTPIDTAEANTSEPRTVAAASSSSSTKTSFVGHAKLIGFFTLISRFLGLGREIVAGHYMGTGLVAAAFTVAFTIPNLFRKLFGEGALSAAFIPLYAQAIKHEHPDRANEFAAAAVNLLCAILLGITVVGEVALGIAILLGGRMWPDLMLTLKFTAIMLPYVLLICGGAFLSGILQVHKKFGPPAAAPIILNVCHIIVLAIGAKVLHLSATRDPREIEAIQITLGYWLAFTVLVAGVLQVIVLLPALRETGFRFKPVLHFWTPMVRRMLKLTLPVALGAGVLQLSVLMDKGISMALMQHTDHAGQILTHFTAFGQQVRFPMESGAPRRLDIAQFLYQFPLGVFAIALATAIFPALSSDALDKDREGFKSVLRHGIEATLWEGLPASVGLILIREPCIRLLFQHGQIDAHQASLIGSSLAYYAGAIWAFSLLQIINRAYYALHDTVTPLVMSIVNIVINLIVEIPLLWWLGESAMAVGTLVSFSIQAVVMLLMLDRKVGGIGINGLLRPTLKMLLATAVMGLSLYVFMRSPLYPRGTVRLLWTMQLSTLLALGAGVYFAASYLLGLQTFRQLLPKRRSR
jgi:putative peptidoglycan lipid II flippase